MLVLIFPLTRDYAIMDDWIYAHAARHLQVTGQFALLDLAVTSLVAQVWWGSVFAGLFGYSWAALTASTLVLSWVGVVCCYGLLRAATLGPGPALLGAGLLLANPLYLHLSFSFMTDVPWLALVLAATLAAVRAMQRGSDRLLLIAMLISALAALVRQPGVVVAAACFGYLLLNRALTPRRISLLLLPLLVLGIYQVWREAQPLAVTVAAEYGSGPSWTLMGLIRLLLLLPTIGLGLLPLAPQAAGRPGRPHALLIPALLTLLLLVAYAGVAAGGWPLDGSGSVLDSRGFLIISDNPRAAPPVLTPAVWVLLTMAAIGVTAWLVVPVRAGLTARWARRGTAAGRAAPVDVAYLTGAGCALVPLLAPWPYDRYILPLWPFLILLLLRWAPPVSRRAWGAGVVLLAGMAAFSLLAQADFADRATAHWAGAEQLLARGVLPADLDAGFEWYGMHSFDALGRPLPDARPRVPPGNGVAGLAYNVEEGLLPGYHPVGQVPYFSRLGGFTTRPVWLLERDR